MHRSLALAVFALLLSAHSSGATLIDLGNVTRDTASGLDWLDLTETQGFSMNDVTNDVGGFHSLGWRHASATEICALFAAYAAAPSPCPGGPG